MEPENIHFEEENHPNQTFILRPACLFSGSVLHKLKNEHTLPKTKSSPLKTDGLKTSFHLGQGLFSIRGGVDIH